MPGKVSDLSAARSQVAKEIASLAGGRVRAKIGGAEKAAPANGEGATPGTTAAAARETVAAAGVHVSVNLNGGVVFLDDERRMRLLAKQIKRLIMEDARRGIGNW